MVGPPFPSTPHAIQGPRDDTGGGRLADTPHTGQHEGMRQASGLDRIGQRADQGLLPDQAGKIGPDDISGQERDKGWRMCCRSSARLL